MFQLEPMRYTTTAAATVGRDSASRRARRIVLITSAAAGAFGLVLLAAPCAAQTVTPKATTVTQSETTTAAIRPFRVNVPEEAPRRPSPTHRGDAVARAGDGRGSIARRAARDDAGARALLGDGLRLAQVRGEAERPAAIHHRDRWAGHSFHPRSFET